MKITLLLIVALSCLVLTAVASPIQIVEAPKDVATTKDIPVGRQQQGGAAVEEDDDDDDDDDDIDDVLDDDDDDDDDDSPSGAADDDDDDDDDDDYLERFFDDILGEEDDDDDDDDVSPSTGVQQAQQAATQAVAQQAAQDNLNESVDYTVDSTGDVEDGLAPVNDDINIQALDQSAKDPISNTVAVQPLDDDDDDDDDEEDDIEDALDVTDDDDDDDDDDDLIGDDVIEARNGEEKRSRALKEAEATPVPEIVIQKYNQFVDRIYERINKVLRKSYDPVTVHLTTSADSKPVANKPKKTNKNKKRNNNNNKLSSRISTDTLSNVQNNATAPKPVARKQRDVPITDVKDTKSDTEASPETLVPKTTAEATAAIQKRANANQNANKVVKKEAASAAAASKQADNRGRGTLYGLSSMRRSGDVRVNAMADFTTVKSNFILGPLILKVEKQFGKSGRRELRVATARTQEMLGRINLRIVNGSAVLHSIKVQQPKQVSIQSKDNHDKTREYLWKRSSHIAHLVSEKLSTAARAMLKPQAKRAAPKV